MIRDDFNRLNNEDLAAAGNATFGGLDQGWGWTNRLSVIQILSNRAVGFGAASQMIARAEIDLGSADHYAQCPVLVEDPGGTWATQAAVCVRQDASATLTFYSFVTYWHFQGPNASLIWVDKWTNGTPVTLFGPQSSTLTAGTPRLLRGEVSTVGADVRLVMKLDDVTLVDILDTTSPILTGERIGIAGTMLADIAPPTWDDLQADVLATFSGFPMVPAMRPPMLHPVHLVM